VIIGLLIIIIQTIYLNPIKGKIESTIELKSQSIIITPTIITTPTPQVTSTVKVTSTALGSETTDAPNYPLSGPITIKMTQEPVIIAAEVPSDSDYMYENARVTFTISAPWNGAVYLNLDDISNNGFENSDFIIYVDTGSVGTTFEIYPTNYARMYYSDKPSMKIQDCEENFPKTYAEEYKQYENFPPSDVMALSGNAYCFVTNEGRMAVINILPDSKISDAKGKMNFSMIVTVAHRIETDLFIPAPTKTVGPTPTPTNRYSARGITDEQAKILDESIQSFITAFKNGDKDTISKMLIYPMTIRITGTWELVKINDQEDFILNYDKIFPEEFSSEFANATIENNVFSFAGTITLECNEGVIGFSDSGKINDISIFKNVNWGNL
jgi:hypothetical protein